MLIQVSILFQRWLRGREVAACVLADARSGMAARLRRCMLYRFSTCRSSSSGWDRLRSSSRPTATTLVSSDSEGQMRETCRQGQGTSTLLTPHLRQADEVTRKLNLCMLVGLQEVRLASPLTGELPPSQKSFPFSIPCSVFFHQPFLFHIVRFRPAVTCLPLPSSLF